MEESKSRLRSVEILWSGEAGIAPLFFKGSVQGQIKLYLECPDEDFRKCLEDAMDVTRALKDLATKMFTGVALELEESFRQKVRGVWNKISEWIERVFG